MEKKGDVIIGMGMVLAALGFLMVFIGSGELDLIEPVPSLVFCGFLLILVGIIIIIGGVVVKVTEKTPTSLPTSPAPSPSVITKEKETIVKEAKRKA